MGVCGDAQCLPVSHLCGATPPWALCCLPRVGWDAKRIQSSDYFASSPILCSADPLGALARVWCPEPCPWLPPGGLLASRTFCLMPADTAAFPADLQRVQMHLINKECAVPAEWLRHGRVGWGGREMGLGRQGGLHGLLVSDQCGGHSESPGRCNGAGSGCRLLGLNLGSDTS